MKTQIGTKETTEHLRKSRCIVLHSLDKWIDKSYIESYREEHKLSDDSPKEKKQTALRIECDMGKG